MIEANIQLNLLKLRYFIRVNFCSFQSDESEIVPAQIGNLLSKTPPAFDSISLVRSSVMIVPNKAAAYELLGSTGKTASEVSLCKPRLSFADQLLSFQHKSVTLASNAVNMDLGKVFNKSECM